MPQPKDIPAVSPAKFQFIVVSYCWRLCTNHSSSLLFSELFFLMYCSQMFWGKRKHEFFHLDYFARSPCLCFHRVFCVHFRLIIICLVSCCLYTCLQLQIRSNTPVYISFASHQTQRCANNSCTNKGVRRGQSRRRNMGFTLANLDELGPNLDHHRANLDELGLNLHLTYT